MWSTVSSSQSFDYPSPWNLFGSPSGGCAKKILSRIQRLFLGMAAAIRITPPRAYLPPLDLVTEGVARSAAHRLWILGCWLPSPQSMTK